MSERRKYWATFAATTIAIMAVFYLYMNEIVSGIFSVAIKVIF